MKYLPSLLASFATLFPAASASPVVFDLAAQFSTTSNPNGVWSYNQSFVPITAPLTVAYGTGWGYNASADASILKVTGGTGFDWQPGDIVMHAVSVPFGGPAQFLDISWTSPGDGTISIFGSAWDAYFDSGRDAAWTLLLNNVAIAGRSSVFGLLRTDAAADFASNLVPAKTLLNIPVSAGDVVDFAVVTQTFFGHFVGVNEQISFTPLSGVPEGGWTAPLLALGAGMLAMTSRQSRMFRARHT